MSQASPVQPWLRSPTFDGGLIGGVAALGLAAGALASTHPGWLPGLLVFDFWLLGYPHLVATWTRLGFDAATAREHRGLLTWLPVVVAIGASALALGVGIWALIALYFYWQAWHYARQGWGLSRIYRRRERGAIAGAPQTSEAEVPEFTRMGRAMAPRRAVPRTNRAGWRTRRLAGFVALELREFSAEAGAVGRPRPTRSHRPEHCDGERRQGVQAAQPAPGGRPQRAAVKGVAERRDRRPTSRTPSGTGIDDHLDSAALFLPVLAGVLHRSAQGWTAFLTLDIRMIPVPDVVAKVAAGAAGLAVLVWAGRQAQRAITGDLALPHALFVVTHVAVFGVGYALIPDLSQGWIALNVWHNAQYLLIVWMYNVNRFREGETATAPLLSAMSQPNAWPRYVFVIYATATILFAVIAGVPGVKVLTVPVVLLFSQTLNFHHYIVDALIWKVRRPEVARLLTSGLGAPP